MAHRTDLVWSFCSFFMTLRLTASIQTIFPLTRRCPPWQCVIRLRSLNRETRRGRLGQLNNKKYNLIDPLHCDFTWINSTWKQVAIFSKIQTFVLANWDRGIFLKSRFLTAHKAPPPVVQAGLALARPITTPVSYTIYKLSFFFC